MNFLTREIAFATIVLFCVPFVLSADDDPIEDDFFDDDDSDPVEDPDDFVGDTVSGEASGVTGVSVRPGGGAIVDHADSITTGAGDTFTNVHGAEFDADGRLVEAASFEFDDGLFNDVTGFEPDEAGGYLIERAGRIVHAGNLLINAEGVRFVDDVLDAASADSFVRGNVVATRLGGLVLGNLSFTVDSAESLLAGCVLVSNVTATTVTTYADGLTLAPDNDQAIAVRDCAFNEVTFSGAVGELRIAATVPATYNVINGSLEYEGDGYRERIEANASAVVELDPQHGIACAEIEPVGTYWYNAIDLRQDFGILIPANGTRYRLCIRKDPSQRFTNYDGLADLVAQRITLSNAARFLKYPFRAGEPVSLLMDELYANEPGFNASLALDRETGLIDTVAITGRAISEHSTAVTTPSSYYELREAAVEGETHRLLRIDFRKPLGALTQSRVVRYLTSYFRPEMTIQDEVLVQRGSNNTIRVLPPGHADIERIMN